MTRYLPLCRRNMAVKEDIEQRKKIEKKIRNVDKADKDKWKWIIEEKFDKEVKLDKEKVRKIMPQKFYKWLKVFEKVKSERMPVRKPWDYVINLREDYMSKKGRTYLMLREKKKNL